MKKLFFTVLKLAKKRGDVTEAKLYPNGDFSKVAFKTENGTYTISMYKEKETDGNN